MSAQNNTERVLDQLQQRRMTVDEANVQMVRNARIRVVSKLPRNVRKALDAAVKRGELGHFKKDWVKPEVYYHPNFKHLAIEARNKAVDAGMRAFKKVCRPHQN